MARTSKELISVKRELQELKDAVGDFNEVAVKLCNAGMLIIDADDDVIAKAFTTRLNRIVELAERK